MNGSAEQLEGALNLAGDAVRREADGTVRLIGSECRDCGRRVFPPGEVCPDCMSENVGEIALGPTGTLYSWSLVHAAPKGWRVPFIAGYVDLPEDVRVFAHIVEADPARLDFDMRVTATVAVLGEDEAGNAVASYAFRPAEEGDA